MEGIPEQASSTNKEVEIGSADGLRRFEEYVEDAKEALEEESTGEGEVYERGRRAYEALKCLIDEAMSGLEEGREVTEVQIDEMQALYNELSIASDEVAVAAIPEESVENLEHEPSLDKDDLTETMSGVVTIEEDTSAPKIEIEAVHEVTVDVIESLSLKAEASVVRANQMVVTFEGPATEHSRSDTFDAIGHYFDELKRTTVRIQAIANTLSRQKKEKKMDSLELENFDDQITEVSENLDQLEGGLTLLLRGVAPATMDAQAASVSQITEGEGSHKEAETLPSSKDEVMESAEEEESEGENEPEEIRMVKPVTGALAIGREEAEIIPLTIKRPVAPTPQPRPVIQQAPLTPAAVTRIESFRPRREEGGELRGPLGSYITDALKDRRYREFLIQAYGESLSDFETALLRHVNAVEKPSHLDSFLGINHESAFFTFLKDMTISQVEQFDQQPREVIRSVLEKKNIEYEVYAVWLDAFYDTLQTVRVPANLSFGELIVRAEIENQMNEYFGKGKSM